MRVAFEEMQDLKGVWTELSKIWEQIDDLKDKPWLSVAPRKVSKILILNVQLLWLIAYIYIVSSTTDMLYSGLAATGKIHSQR